MRIFAVAAGALCLAGSILWGQSPVRKVSVFKNGSALVMREGTAEINNGKFILPITENIVYGTLTVGVEKDAGLHGVIARIDTIHKSVPCAGIRDYLKANVGNYATLKIQYGGEKPFEKVFSGTIEHISKDNILRLRTDAGATAIFNAGSVDYAEVRGNAVSACTSDSIVKQLHVQTKRQSGTTDVQTSYMTRGLIWVPTYTVRMQSDSTAQLDLRATIENNMEDLTNSDVEFIIGAPEMSYLSKIDPLFYTNRATFGMEYSGVENSLVISNNAAVSNSISGTSNFITGTTTKIDAANIPPTTTTEGNSGEKSGDIYVYSLKDITLQKSERGMFTIASRTVKATDRYETTLKSTLGDLWGCLTNRLEGWSKNMEVFHSLELWNAGDSPLTAGAMTVFDNAGRTIGQNTVYYTPAGSKTYVRLSKAIDITMNSSEEETAREENAKKIKKTVYTKSKMHGTLTVTNYQNKSVALSVNRELAGTVLTASDGGKKTKTIVPNELNAASKIEWQVTVGAGETKTLEYEYEIFFTP